MPPSFSTCSRVLPSGTLSLTLSGPFHEIASTYSSGPLFTREILLWRWSVRVDPCIFEARLLLWPAASMQSLPVAEHLPHAHSASRSQVPDIVPVPQSVAISDPQHPEKWDLSSQCFPLHTRISRRSSSSCSWPCYPTAPGGAAPTPRSSLLRSCQAGDLPALS